MKIKQNQIRVFANKAFYRDAECDTDVDAQALAWTLAMEDEGWTCSRITRIVGNGRVALVWKWVQA